MTGRTHIFRSALRVLVVGCAFWAVAAPACAAGAAPAGAARELAQGESLEDERLELGSRFSAAMRAGDLESAAAVAQRLTALVPHDALAAHNLACVQARRGELAAAWRALAASLAGPLADPRLAENDPDLAPLRGEPRFQTLLAEARERLGREAAARRLVLRDGHFSREMPLLSNNGDPLPAGAVGPRVRVRVRSDAGGLEFAATVQASSFAENAQPWRLGDGFRITVAIPEPDGRYESDRSFAFGFGVSDGVPVAALIERNGRPQTAQVLELAPKVRLEEARGRATFGMRLPWAAISPFAPPVDTLLGLNIAYVHAVTGRAPLILSLMPEPALVSAREGWRRYLPVEIDPSELSRPVLGGAVANAVVGGGLLGVRLAAWLPAAGEAGLRVDILDADGRSVVASGRIDERVRTSAGLNRWARTADLSDLPDGPFRLVAELEPDGGEPLRWDANLLRLDPLWLEDAHSRAARAAPGDRPSLEYRLEAIAEELDRRDPRSDPSPLTATVVETGILLRRLEQTGTVLPDSGRFVAAFRAADGRFQACSLVLPAGVRERRAPRVLVLMPSGGAANRRTAALVAEQAGLPPDVIALIPSWRPEARGEPLDAAAEAIAAARWARGRFRAREVLLAGFNAGAGDALRASLDDPRAWDRVLIMADRAWHPWPHLDDDLLAARLAAQRNQLPYRIIVAVPPPLDPASAAPAIPGRGRGARTFPDPVSRPAPPDQVAPGEELPAAMAAAGFDIDRWRHGSTVISGAVAAARLGEWTRARPAVKPRRN